MRVSFLLPPEFLENKSYEEAWNCQPPPSHENRVMGTLESWLYQTWFLLKQKGILCDLVAEPPDEGIVLVHWDKYHEDLRHPVELSRDLYVVEVVADCPPHPDSHLYLVQNSAYGKLLPDSIFMPHWPQPFLIPRDSKRGFLFENIFFFGFSGNLASELLSEEWNAQLRRKTGLYFEIKEPSCWHDYSDVDAVLAIRDFSRSPQFHKPATKLYNAWLAGVPFIGGRDTAYISDGHSGKDYLRAFCKTRKVECCF